MGDASPRADTQPCPSPQTKPQLASATETLDIDSPHLPGERRLNRRVNLILSQSRSTEGNSWEFTGNRCGNRVGIWDLDRVPLKSLASGSARTFFGPVTVT